MRSILFSMVGVVFTIVSCSKCYKCTSEVNVSNNGQTVVDTTEQELCTASAQEVEDLENQGYLCRVES